MVDLILVEQRLEMMSDFLGSLGDLTSIPRSEFLRDPLRIAAAESYLTRSLMGLFDVGRYLLPGSDQSDPDEEYKSIARG